MHCQRRAKIVATPEPASALARRESPARPGNVVVIAAGMPLGTACTTNLLHIAKA